MRSITRFLLISIMITLISEITYSQESTKQKSADFWHRVNVGGYLSMQLGNTTGIVVAPEAQIKIIDQLYGGFGVTYQYYWYKNYYWLYKTDPTQFINYSESVYGGKIFFRYYLRSLFDNFLGNIFAHVEYEYLYYVRPIKQDQTGDITDGYRFYTTKKGSEVIEVNSLFVGGGYSQPIAGKVFVDILVLFNLNDSYNSPYKNPVIRIGFGVGL